MDDLGVVCKRVRAEALGPRSPFRVKNLTLTGGPVPPRKADIEVYLNLDQFVPFAGATSILFVMDESKCCTKPRHH